MAEKLTRKEAKERTRQKLLDGLLSVARKEGLQGLTTTKIAEAAGVAQSSFYFHFEGMEDAMQAAADKLGNQVRDQIRAQRRKIVIDNPRETLRNSCAANLNAFLSEPVFTQLFLRHRRDPTSPLGRCFADLLDQSRKELAADMKAVGLALPNIDVYAELFIGMSMTMLEGLIDGRIQSKDACLDALVHVIGLALTNPPRMS